MPSHPLRALLFELCLIAASVGLGALINPALGALLLVVGTIGGGIVLLWEWRPWQGGGSAGLKAECLQLSDAIRHFLQDRLTHEPSEIISPSPDNMFFRLRDLTGYRSQTVRMYHERFSERVAKSHDALAKKRRSTSGFDAIYLTPMNPLEIGQVADWLHTLGQML